MTDFDDDLRRALAPLAGDDRAVARAVLEQLPEAPAAGPRRPLPWGLVAAAAAAAGLLVGALVQGLWAVRPTAETVQPGAVGDGPVAVTPAVELLVRATRGELWARRPGAGAAFQPAAMFDRLPSPSVLKTGADSLAEVGLPGGARLRMNQRTSLEVELDRSRVVFLDGHAWLACERAGYELQHGDIAVRWQGPAILDLQAAEETFAVLALEGEVLVVGPDGTRRWLRPSQRVEVRGGVFGNRETVYWTHEAIEWQLGLLCSGRDQKELSLWVEPLLEVLSEPDFAEVAMAALRRMGSCSVEPLLGYLAAAEPDRIEPRRRAARVIADTAGFQHLDGLFTRLRDRDGEVRVAVYEALRRVTGMDWGDDALWRSASQRELELEIAAWREAMKR